MVGKSPDSYKPYTPVEIDTDHMDLLIKTYPQGKVSRDLFALQAGDTVFIRGPREKFEIDRFLHGTRRLIAFAGGTGVAPIYQVIKYLASAKNDYFNLEEIILFYANKTRQDILLKDELAALKLKLPNFKVIDIIESERGYIQNGDNINRELEGKEDDFVLICGPKGFNENLIGNGKVEGILMEKMKYKREQIYNF